MVLFFLGASTYLVILVFDWFFYSWLIGLQNVFFLPFYFQAVHGHSPVASGVDFIPLMLSEMVALIITGAVVKQWGHYVSFLL
jgi:hypothetical protein